MNRLRTYFSRTTPTTSVTGRRSGRRAPRAHEPVLGRARGNDAVPPISLSIR